MATAARKDRTSWKIKKTPSTKKDRQIVNSPNTIMDVIFIIVPSFLLPFFLLKQSKSSIFNILGNGDLLGFYNFQQSIWQYKTLNSNHFGFPIGQDLSLTPVSNLGQTLLTGFFTLFFDSVISAVNAVWVISYPITALVVYFLSKKLKLQRPFTLLVPYIVITLPWLTSRLNHWDFLFVCVALIPILFFPFSHIPKWRIISVGFVCGIFGPYIAIFSLIVLLGLFFGLAICDHKGSIPKFALIVSGVFIGTGLSYFIYSDFLKSSPGDFLQRGIQESLMYGGIPGLLFSPLPWIKTISGFHALPDVSPHLSEADSFSNFGNWAFFLTVVLVLAIILFKLLRKTIAPGTRSKSLENKAFLYLLPVLGSLFSFFIVGGGGYFFAILITPSIRAWNRSALLIQVIIILLCFVYLSSTLTKRRSKNLVATALSLAIIVDVFGLQPLAPREDTVQNASIKATAEYVDNALPEGCALLQLPFVPFPEYPTVGALTDYSQFRVPLLNRNHKWSYGAMKTRENLEIQNRILEDFWRNPSDSPFCAVMLDLPGDFDSSLENRLDSLLPLIYISPNQEIKIFSIKSKDRD
jgi:phosphoglycerol transferase